MKTAHIFPAFIHEYLGTETDVVKSYGVDFHGYLQQASEVTGTDLTAFDIETNNFLDKQLESQYLTYIYGCSVSDIMHMKNRLPDYVSSYSMGIYAALYHCGCYDFVTGLNIIKTAYALVEKYKPAEPCGMASIVGLSLGDIVRIIKPIKKLVSIGNHISQYSFLLSGKLEHLEPIIEAAKADGAMQARLLNVTHPYHAHMLSKVYSDFINILLRTKEIVAAQYPYVSAQWHNILTDKNKIKSEIAFNVISPIRWQATMDFMIKKETTTFIECGAGDSLYKIGKFIEGDFKIINLKKIKSYLADEQ